MATRKLGTAVLMLAVVLWGTLLGGIVYSHLVFFPVYLSDLPNSAVLVNGPYALNETPFWLIIHPLLVISLIVALVFNWNGPRRKLIVISLIVYAVIIIITQIYFVPELILFKHSPESTVPAADWLARGRSWQRLSWLRGVISYLAFIPLLIALTKPADDLQL